jgi:hypothetical protein
MAGRRVKAGQERHEHKDSDRCGNPTAIIFACIPAGSFATPPAKPLVEDPALEGGLPVNPAVLAACTVASGEALPLDWLLEPRFRGDETILGGPVSETDLGAVRLVCSGKGGLDTDRLDISGGLRRESWCVVDGVVCGGCVPGDCVSGDCGDCSAVGGVGVGGVVVVVGIAGAVVVCGSPA